jgi:hypothetical protein
VIEQPVRDRPVEPGDSNGDPIRNQQSQESPAEKVARREKIAG